MEADAIQRQLKHYTALTPYFVDDFDHTSENYKIYQIKTGDLPEDLFSVLVDEKTYGFIVRSMEQYGLTVEQGRDLSRVVRDVIIDDLYLGDVVRAVREKLGLDEQNARELANGMASELFAPVIEDLKERQVKKFVKPKITGMPPSMEMPSLGGRQQKAEEENGANRPESPAQTTQNPSQPQNRPQTPVDPNQISNQNNIIDLRAKKP